MCKRTDQVLQAVYFYTRCFSAAILLVIVNACGSSGSRDSVNNSTIKIFDANTGSVIAPGSSVFTLTEVRFNGVDLSNALVRFVSPDGSVKPMQSDAGHPDQFLLPVVLKKTNGKLLVTQSDGQSFRIPLIINSYPTTGVPGEVSRKYIQANLFKLEKLIVVADLIKPIQPELLGALIVARSLVQQKLSWINAVMQNGSAVIVENQNDSLLILKEDDLRTLDQIVLYMSSPSAQHGKLTQVAYSNSSASLPIKMNDD